MCDSHGVLLVTATLFVGTLSPLEKWGAIWAIVAGVIAAILFVGGVYRLAADLYTRPKLEIEAGDGAEFNKRIASTDSFVAAVVEGNELGIALGKVIRVRETKGRSSAKGVVVRMVNVDPPNPDFRTATVRWASGQDEVTIQPHGHQEAYVQLVVCFDGADVAHVRGVPPLLEHAERVELDLEILLDGRWHGRQRVRIEHPWPGDLMERRTADGRWPDDVTFPNVTLLSSVSA